MFVEGEPVRLAQAIVNDVAEDGFHDGLEATVRLGGAFYRREYRGVVSFARPMPSR
jgi:hypothetical protein